MHENVTMSPKAKMLVIMKGVLFFRHNNQMAVRKWYTDELNNATSEGTFPQGNMLINSGHTHC